MIEENQTVFAQEEPLLEHADVSSNSQDDVAAQIAQKNKKKKQMIVVISVFCVLFLLLLSVGIASQKKRVIRPDVVQPTPTASTQQRLTEIEKALQSLHTDVEKGDPSVNDLPFPPIDFTLSIKTEE